MRDNPTRGRATPQNLCRLALLMAIAVYGHVLSAQVVPVITTAYATEVTIDGTAPPGSGPVDVFDISYEAETLIGSGQVAADGQFAAVVNPRLIQDHRLVAVDREGRRSAPFVVRAARPGPVR
jgi:hypothetical protein